MSLSIYWCVPQVEQSWAIGSTTHAYSCSTTPSVTEGPAVHWLPHAGQAGHRAGEPEDCVQCGQCIAQVLRELGVGSSASGKTRVPG